jgi:hypothetical protein
MNATILPKADVSYLDSQLLCNDKLIIKPASFFKSLNYEHLIIWCHKHGIYCIPTTELIDWLKPHIVKDKTIEIGAGNGALGRALNIPITDSCYMRNNEQVILTYTLIGQPLTKYPDDIIELDAIDAIKRYVPDVVIGSWITHKYNPEQHEREGNMFGVDEQFILDNVKKYIMIGNESVHKHKPIFDKPFTTFKADWLISRSMRPDLNIIYIWEKQ